MSGWNPPPAPGGPPPGPYGYGAPGPGPYAPPPPRRSSNTGLIIGLVFGVGAIFAVIIVAVIVMIAVTTTRSIADPLPSSAGGYSRDFGTESRISSQLSSQRSIIRRATGYRIGTVQSAVYGTGSTKYLFVGGDGNFDPDDLYSQFRSAVNSEISSNVTVTVVPLSDAGGPGEAVCATVLNRQSSGSYSTALCAWATDDTFGTIMPVPDTSSLSTARNYSYVSVAATMRLMRDDLEE